MNTNNFAIDFFSQTFTINLTFQGHYNENILKLQVPKKLLRENDNELKINILCNPYTYDQSKKHIGNWEVAAAFKDIHEDMKPICEIKFE